MKRGRPAGLSLVEVLVAIAMLAIIGAAVLAFLPTIVGLNRDANNDQQITAASKLFFEGLSGMASPSTLVSGNYAAGEAMAGSTVTVPQDCRASVSQPDAELAITRVVLSCDGVVHQVLELSSAS